MNSCLLCGGVKKRDPWHGKQYGQMHRDVGKHGAAGCKSSKADWGRSTKGFVYSRLWSLSFGNGSCGGCNVLAIEACSSTYLRSISLASKMEKRGDVSLKAERTVRSLLPNPAENGGPSGDGKEGKNGVMLRRLSQKDKTLRDGGVTGVKSKLFSGLDPEEVGW